MDIRELRYFVAAFETGAVSAAARRCYVSQPSISSAVAALEAELGTTLFIRHKKGVTPTASAEALYPRARSMVDEAAALGRLFKASTPSPRLTLGLMRTLDIARTVALLTPLTEGEALDLALVDADQPCDARIIASGQARPEETFLPLWTEPYVVALPPQHPFRFKAEVTVAELAELRLIDRCHCENAALIAQLAFRPRVVATATSEDWALALVRAGVGAAVMPKGAVREDAGVVVRPLAQISVERRVGLAYGKVPPPQLGRLVAALGAPSPPGSARTAGAVADTRR
jgi:DNA-binding transcriptional LysR family regulator